MKRDLGNMTDRQWFWYSVRTYYLPMAFNISVMSLCIVALGKMILRLACTSLASASN